jgi:PAS domain S-box-containing protein
MTESGSNAAFEELAKNPLAVLWTMSLSGEIAEVSDSIFAVRGLTPEEAKAQSPDQIHPPESIQRSLAYFEYFSRTLLAGEIPEAFSATLDYIHKDGSVVPCQVIAEVMVSAEGLPTGLRGVSVPIS